MGILGEENNTILINPNIIAPRLLNERIMVEVYSDKVQFMGAKSLIDDLIWDLENL